MTLLELTLYFMVLSLFSVGGMPSVMPELQRYVVDVKGLDVTPRTSSRSSRSGRPRPARTC